MKDELTRSMPESAPPGVRPAPDTPVARNNFARPSSVSRNRTANPSTSLPSPSSVELHIEELALHGFAASERHLIGDAFERELTRLLTTRGVPLAIAHGGEIARPGEVAFEVQPGFDAETTGVQLAQAIYEGLGS